MEIRQQKLLEFVKIGHFEQVRKYTGEPYYLHTLHVGTEADKRNIPYGFEIGICHDLFEDTSLQEEILRLFLASIGYAYIEVNIIIAGIIHLTDLYTKENYPELNRQTRKQLECERLHQIPPVIQDIKMIDLINNSESICEHDNNFARIYLKEKWRILKGMNAGSKDLYNQCIQILIDGLNKLSDEPIEEW